MGHVVRRETGYRTESGKEFDERIYYYEHARTYRDGDKKDEHRNIGIEPTEGEQDAEYGTGGADSIHYVGVLCDSGSAIPTGHIVEHECPRGFLYESGTQTANEVVEQETACTELLLDHRRKHPHCKHIKEYVAEIGVKEHVGERLPPVERLGSDIMETAQVVQTDTVTLQRGCEQKDKQIGYQQIASSCR